MVTIRYATRGNIDRALQQTTEYFEENVIYNRFEQKGKNFFVTLKVKNSKGKGARRGYHGKAMVQACWHVYGVFFDELIRANPAIVIVAMGKKIGAGYGNWIDPEVGSMANPMRYSQLCGCGRVLHKDGMPYSRMNTNSGGN